MKDNSQKDWIRMSEELTVLIGRRAENLFETGQLLCSEAVIYVLNEGLAGGLPQETAISLASGFGEGIGSSGCMCGAFAGAVMSLGLFLGRQEVNGKGSKRVLAKAGELHNCFASKFGAICCKVLTKKADVDYKNLLDRCKLQTGEAAEMAARIILEARPYLVDQADWKFLRTQDSRLGAGLNRVLSLIRPQSAIKQTGCDRQ